jgi:hypothetical protein
MTRAEAEALARERLAFLADSYEEHGNRDWNALAEAARRALAGDRSAATVFRRVFEERGFAVSASGMEVGYAALGIALCGDAGGLVYFAAREMPFNGIDEQLAAARLLLTATS